MEKLDAICMQLIAIGESLKNLDKVTKGVLLHQYPQIDWKKVKGLRDIISHHYFDLNAEAIFDVCGNHIEKLSHTIEGIINFKKTAILGQLPRVVLRCTDSRSSGLVNRTPPAAGWSHCSALQFAATPWAGP